MLVFLVVGLKASYTKGYRATLLIYEAILTVGHYPAYCSKYNPIEHRLFPHVTRACQGMVFTSIDCVKKLISRTKTKKGLQVVVNTISTVYKKDRKVGDDFKKNIHILFDSTLPKWKYRALPQND